MPDKKSSTKEKTTKKSGCKCGENCQCCSRSIFPICFLACMITAALVSLGFAVGIAANVAYKTQSDYVLRSAGAFAKETDNISDKTIIALSASGAIDLFSSGQTGFLYAAPGNCAQCSSFELRLLDAIREKGISGQVYKYTYPNNPSDFDKFAHEATIASEDGPVLLYVRDGRIYDRLDETNGDLAVATFLAKYKK